MIASLWHSLSHNWDNQEHFVVLRFLISQPCYVTRNWFSSAHCWWRMYTTKGELDLHWCLNMFPFWSSEPTLETHSSGQDLFWNKRKRENVTSYKHVFFLQHTEWKRKDQSSLGISTQWLPLIRSVHERVKFCCNETTAQYFQFFSWILFFFAPPRCIVIFL